MAVTLTGFGGVGEIGGNAFLLDDGKAPLFLDLGKRFGHVEAKRDGSGPRRRFHDGTFDRPAGWNDFFSEYLRPRSFGAANDLMALGLAPRMPSLYRQDLGGQPGASPVAGIVVSHAHLDHCGLLGLVRPDIPVLCSPGTAATLSSLQATGKGGWETDFVDVPLRGGVQWSTDRSTKQKRLSVRWQLSGDDPVPQRTLGPQALGDSGGWTVEHHEVDHSIQGASAFLLDSGDLRVVYTGDFRRHGRHPERTERFLRSAAACDVLLIEGTRAEHHAHGHDTDTESDVEGEVCSFIEADPNGLDGFVGVSYPVRDLDRFVSLWNVAKRMGRRLLMTTKQAHLVSTLRRAQGRDDLPDPRGDPHLGIYLKAEGKGSILTPNQAAVGDKATLGLAAVQLGADQWARLVARELEPWERSLLGIEDGGPAPVGEPWLVTPEQVRREPNAYLFSLSLWNMTDLLDIFPDRAAARGLYIHSQTQPHNDDMELDEYRVRRWMQAFRLGDHRAPSLLKTHVSGHAGLDDLVHILDELRPKAVVPIHTEVPNWCRDWHEGQAARLGIRTNILPVAPGQALRLG